MDFTGQEFPPLPFYTNFYMPIHKNYWCVRWNRCGRYAVSEVKPGELSYMVENCYNLSRLGERIAVTGKYSGFGWSLVLWNTLGDQVFILKPSAEEYVARGFVGYEHVKERKVPAKLEKEGNLAVQISVEHGYIKVHHLSAI